eukprot:scaffold156_cov308-Prasinococcus_capsulatus_cf.AAC.20
MGLQTYAATAPLRPPASRRLWMGAGPARGSCSCARMGSYAPSRKRFFVPSRRIAAGSPVLAVTGAAIERRRRRRKRQRLAHRSPAAAASAASSCCSRERDAPACSPLTPSMRPMV